MKTKKITFIILGLLLIFSSCRKEECITCIAQAESGKIMETRLACDKSERYLKGFGDGVKEKYKDVDSINVYCAYSE